MKAGRSRVLTAHSEGAAAALSGARDVASGGSRLPSSLIPHPFRRWRSGPVRSLMAAVLRRAGPAGGARRTGDYRAPMTKISTARSPAAITGSEGRGCE